eukprot:TRINITY_DN9193_c0_g1_i7.p2 TRINITY_DN9193_c0_g1~~TRINITY_DN9193_c0_g1_i7.p2  ORF type:complete len:168 (+),score=41.67 TRINITY_DN9193_c0_g1_i7:1719-2222(+)
MSPIRKRDSGSSYIERLMYYRTRSTYPPKSEPKKSSIRELYREAETERSLKGRKLPLEPRSEPTRAYALIKEDIEVASTKVEQILEDLRFYKSKYENFIQNAQEYQQPRAKSSITEDQIQDCIAQCQALGRQIDLLQEKYDRIFKANANKTSAIQVKKQVYDFLCDT